MLKTQKLNAQKLIVQKYGGATLATPEKIKSVALKISDLKKSGYAVVVVVSAMGQTTNQLIELSQQVSKNPSLREMDMLISVGERISMSLLSMALNDLGCEAISFTGSQAGILTDDDHISANIIDVTPVRVQQALEKNKVVVLAGFQGVSQKTKEITTLGRGGSDITAVAMAFALEAGRCEILKDVDSIFTADPNSINTAKPIRHLNTDQLFEMTFWGAKVLNYKSVERFHSPNKSQMPKPELYIGPAHKTVSNRGTESSSVQLGTVVHSTIDRSLFSFFDGNYQSDVLSINSVSEAWLVSTNEFERKLKESQQSLSTSSKTLPFNATQILKTVEAGQWITAPQEILNQLRSHIGIKEDLSVVTVTLTEKAKKSDIKTELQRQIDNIKYVFESEYSLHLFCESENKKINIEKIHSLYFK